MNANAMIGPYIKDFASKEHAKKILKTTPNDFSHLPRSSNGTLVLQNGQALYIYGGRKAVTKALDKLTLIVKPSPNKLLVAYLTTRKVKVNGIKKIKRLLAITPASDHSSSATVMPEVNVNGEMRFKELIRINLIEAKIQSNR